MIKVCENCGKEFQVVGRTIAQKRCPVYISTSNEQIKSIPLQRDELFRGVAAINGLPPVDWQHHRAKQSHDMAYVKIDITGKSLADGYSVKRPLGRIVINASKPATYGDVVDVRVVDAMHDTKDGNTERRQYVTLTPINEEPVWSLDWHDAWGDTPLSTEWIWDGEMFFITVYGGDNGRVGVLALTRLPDPADDEDESFYDEYSWQLDADEEYLLGGSTLAKLRSGE